MSLKLSKQLTKELAEAGFSPEDLAVIPEDSTGLLLVLKPDVLKPSYRMKPYLVQRANGGFGCRRSSGGNAVFCTCAADGEDARYNKFEFCARYVGEPITPVCSTRTSE